MFCYGFGLLNETHLRHSFAISGILDNILKSQQMDR